MDEKTKEQHQAKAAETKQNEEIVGGHLGSEQMTYFNRYYP